MATPENYADLLQETKRAREAVEPGLLQDLNVVSRSKSSQEIPHQHVKNLLDSGTKKPSIRNIAHHKAKRTMAKQSRKNNRRRK